EDLWRAARRVYIAVARHTRLPRRYRGRDMTWWFNTLRLFQLKPEQRGPLRVHPTITGAYGGHTIDFRRFAADGVTLLGHLEAAREGFIEVAPDLAKNLANGDAIYNIFIDMADAYVKRRAPDMPEDPGGRAVLPDPPCVTDPLRRLDLRKEGIGAVIWATGYGVDFGWIDVPVLDGRGEPVHRDGITAVSGLYFLGLQWLSTANSSFLS